jgi:hypothetical protein
VAGINRLHKVHGVHSFKRAPPDLCVRALETSTVGGLGPIWAVTGSYLIYKNVQSGRSVLCLLWILAATISDWNICLYFA